MKQMQPQKRSLSAAISDAGAMAPKGLATRHFVNEDVSSKRKAGYRR